MLYLLKLVAFLFKRGNKFVKSWRIIQQSELYKSIVNKVNLLVGLLPAILATIILVDFLAAKLDLQIFDMLPDKLQLVFMMPAVVIMAFGPIGLAVALLMIPLGYYWTYKFFFFKEKSS